MRTKQYQAYANATQTMATTRQIVVLYDAIIRNLRQASEATEQGRVEDRYHLLVKASEIVFGLQGCLDFDNGGEVASVLYNFYSSVDARILALHRHGDEKAYARLIEDIRQMRNVWADIDSAQGEQGAQQAEAVPAAYTPRPEDSSDKVAFSA